MGSALQGLPTSILLAAVIAVVVGAVLVALKVASGHGGTKKITTIAALVGSATESATMAQQNTLPLLTFVHLNYAIAYMRAAKEASSTEFIWRHLRVNADEKLEEWTTLHLATQTLIHDRYPDLQPEGVHAINAGHIVRSSARKS